jgi:Periviscerokinin family
MKRVLLAGVLGGIAMFIWSSIAHVALPLGRTGIREIPNEQVVLSGMQAQLGGTSGLYAFPGMGLGPNPTREEENAAMQQYEQKLAANPSGILIYHPPGAKSLTPGQLITECLTELAEALLLAWLLAQTTLATFASRMGFVVMAAIMATITTNIPYWNWYGFPASYTTAYISIEFVGYLLAGAVVAAMLKMKAAARTTLAVAA